MSDLVDEVQLRTVRINHLFFVLIAKFFFRLKKQKLFLLSRWDHHEMRLLLWESSSLFFLITIMRHMFVEKENIDIFIKKINLSVGVDNSYVELINTVSFFPVCDLCFYFEKKKKLIYLAFRLSWSLAVSV